MKPNAEQQFLYGHHVLKSGLGRITDNTPTHAGVVVFSMNDIPLVSFGGVIHEFLMMYLLSFFRDLVLLQNLQQIAEEQIQQL